MGDEAVGRARCCRSIRVRLDQADDLRKAIPFATASTLWSSRGPIRRVALAGAAIVLLMAGALGVSVWRSEVSARFAGRALMDEKQVATAASGHDLLFDRATAFATNRPLSASGLAGLRAAQQTFAQRFGVSQKAANPTDTRLLDRIRAANGHLLRLEGAITPLLGRPAALAALPSLRAPRQVLELAIDSYVADNTRDAVSSDAQSQAAHRDSRLVAITVGALAVLLAASLVLYMVGLLKSSFARIRADGALLEAQLQEVEDARLETLQRLAMAAEYRDDDTLQHTERVGCLAAQVAERMGLPPEAVRLIRQAAPLHDVGKLGVSDTILLKPGRLTPEELELMKRHSAIGAAILAGSSSPVLQLGETIAHWHHERWDGSGYPDALSHEAIPISARIVAIADVFDALTHERPYKHAWATDDALDEITALRGRQFDPLVADAFLSLDHQRTTPPNSRPHTDVFAPLAA
jgi:HD-GYP domain-containing protein (c-di-GMP phosphodiesterase class II)